MHCKPKSKQNVDQSAVQCIKAQLPEEGNYTALTTLLTLAAAATAAADSEYRKNEDTNTDALTTLLALAAAAVTHTVLAVLL